MSTVQPRQDADPGVVMRSGTERGRDTTQPEEIAISTTALTSILVFLIAIWSLLAGLVLVFFQGTGSGSLGVGVADTSGQRLLGAHLIMLALVYTLIALRNERYRGLLWLPFASQGAVLFAVGYSILNGDTDFGDGILAVAVSAIFHLLAGFVWISEQRTLAQRRLEREEAALNRLDEQSGPDQTVHNAY